MSNATAPSRLPEIVGALREDQRAGYARVDLGRAARLGGALWGIAAVCLAGLLPLAKPTDAIGNAGWLVAAAVAVACGLGAVRLLRKGESVNPNELYAMSFGAIASIALLEWLAGGQSPYQLLYLLSVVYTACAHPPRRVLAYLAVLGPVMALTLIGSQDLGEEFAGTALQYVLSVGLGLAGLVLMAGTRTQRATLALEGDEARDMAARDFLTGLGNRRRLMADLERCFADERPYVLALFDLDGFKSYNDDFGHAAGDDLLARAAGRLAEAVEGRGRAYRMGGDEFCVLLPADDDGVHDTLGRAGVALSAEGDGFSVGSSHGVAHLPDEATTPSVALRLADQRMYAQKSRGRTSPGRQSTEVLLQVLSERNPALGTHLDDVTRLCEAVAVRVGLSDEHVTPLLQAASLHDVGKAAIPDSILHKPGPLDEEEWSFMRRHTLIGERILSAAPALTAAARLVRASHERWDGDGYPDGIAGEAIPLGARIIFVCDAYDAMTSTRSYRTAMEPVDALAELDRCAGKQFDPRVVEAFMEAHEHLHITA